MDRNKPGYMNFDDIADRLESGKLNAYDVVYTKDTHEVVFIKEDLSLIRMKCRLDVYPSVVVAEYYLNLNTDTYVGQIIGIEQGDWICLYNVNYADNKFIVRKVGVDEYGQLANKPQINGVTLVGNKTTEQLGINIPTKFSQLYDDIGYVTFDHLIENYYSKSQTYSKSEVDTALAGKADTGDIPTDLADLQDDSTHRTVTDEDIAAWNAKSNIVANPTEATEALNSIEIDGVGYAIAGSGGGAVHSVNGKTGDVTLNANDVGALPDDTPLFSGDYNDLENKPDIPDDLADLHDDTNHRTVTDAEKTQWNAAEANVQADWNQTTTSADDYIKNKPTNLVQDANYVHTDNNFTNANKTKLNDIEAGAEVNVQSDWNQSDSTQDDYIKNKPSIPDPQIQSDWNQTSGTAKDFIKNKPTLGSASALDVATSGDASATQVVKGDDSRLSDARTPISHTHTLSEITDAGTAASKNSTSSVTAGSTDLVESGAVKTAIDNAISGAYKHAGTKTCAELISNLLIASNNGNVYNITDSGTTTADFIEGAGIPIRAGDNVGVAKVGDNTYKFDLLSGFIDTSNFVNKSSTSGLIRNDGSIDPTEYAPVSSVPAAQIQSDWSQSDNTKLDYIKNKPTLGTASAKNIPASGNAGTSEVVMGNDTRLTDARNAADVYSWAKAENKPSYSKSEVGLGNVDNTSDTTKKTNFTGSIASGNTGFVTGGDAYTELNKKVDKVDGKALSSNDYTDTDKGKIDALGTASTKDVPTSGNASTSQVVMGSDTRLSDARPASDVSAWAKASTKPSYSKAEVGLGNVDNTSDADKPISTATQTALDNKVDKDGDKVLSTNDYTDEDKDKLDGISEGATKTGVSSVNGHLEIDDEDVTVYDDTEIKNALSTDTTEVEGNPLNFSTLSAQNAESTIIDLEPIQDLHGYDKPWVGGAGKNIFNYDTLTYPYTENDVVVSNNDGVINLNGTAGSPEFIFPNNQGQAPLNPLVYGNLKPSTEYIFTTNYSTNITLQVFYKVSGSSWTQLASSTNTGVLSFTTPSSYDVLWIRFKFASGTQFNNVKIYPMIRLATISDATWEKYENICPISGHDQINVLGCGKNLLSDGMNTNNGYVRSAYLNSSGEEIYNTGWNINEYFRVESNKSYVWSNTKGNVSNNVCVCFYDKNKQYISGVNHSTSPKIITTPSNAVYARGCSYSDTSSLGFNQIEKNNQATQYVAYQLSNDLTISFGQTVYGGTLDVENGVLVVDWIKKVLADGDFDGFFENTTYGSFATIPMASGVLYQNDTTINVISSIATGVSFNDRISNPNIYRVFIDQTNNIVVRTSITDNATSMAEIKTKYIGTDLLYRLATPITYQLTPNVITLLEGVNNISTTGDKITLTYRNGKFATLDGAVPKMTFRGEDYTIGVDDIGLFLKNLTKSTKTYITDPLLNFDGTVATYKKIMKQWFINNGVNIMDSTGITYLCERWYEITKQGWKGGTSFPEVGVSTGSTGTRFDDNVGMSVTPSTDTSANTDTYQGLPLFAITDCNWELDSDGNILITAIDGITDNFVRDDPTKFVGVMQQTGWVKKVDDASTQKYYYADDKNAYEDLVPLPEAIKLDGTVRSFVVHAKYMSGIVDSKMTCCSGVIPRRNISHDGLVTLPDNIGTQYSGGTSVDWSFLVWMQRIKYASLTSDGVLQGCCNYNYQYYVKVSETGVKRLILSSANGANLKVGSTVTFGAYAGNADRGQAATYSISGQDGAIITAIEDVTIDSTTYKAIYVDTTSTFDTVANGDATNGTTIVSTHHWVSGSCDNVKGNDGSPVSATNGVYPAKLQGIEYMVGGYEVFADVIMNISGGYYNPYYARKSTDQATSITSSMAQSTLKCAQPSSDAWKYIQKHGFDGEIFYPILTGTSSSEYMKDGFYENGTGTTTGTREWLAFGGLASGSGSAGLSCLTGAAGLGHGGCYFVARLSCNGNRGILLTA